MHFIDNCNQWCHTTCFVKLKGLNECTEQYMHFVESLFSSSSFQNYPLETQIEVWINEIDRIVFFCLVLSIKRQQFVTVTLYRLSQEW